MYESKSGRSRFAEKILRLFTSENESEAFVGDLDEFCSEPDRNLLLNGVWFWYQIIRSVIVLLIQSTIWSIFMFKNYFQLSFRNFMRHKLYSLINFMGLSIGLTAGILILLYVRHEFNYDKFHERSQDIYRIILEHPVRFSQYRTFFASTPPAMGPAMLNEFPEVELASRYDNGPQLISIDDKKYKTSSFYYADTDLLKIFDFPLKSGLIENVLSEPFSVVITEETSAQYFGSDDPVGKIITANGKHNFTVKGVLENLPQNTYFDFDILGSISSLESIRGVGTLSTWGNISYELFVRMHPDAVPDSLEARMPELISRNNYGGNPKDRFFPQPISDVHLYGDMLDLAGNINFRNLFIYAGIALFLVLIACMNYMNLSTARASIRIKEVGMRKVLGAKRSELFRQFMMESTIVTGIAFMLSIMLTYFILPFMNVHLDREIDFSTIFSSEIIMGLTGLLIVASLFAGSYPALIMSSFKTENMLKNKFVRTGRSKLFTRNSLVVFQYAISVLLIISTLVVFKQIAFMKTINPGFNKDSVINLRINDRGLRSAAFQNELLSHPSVLEITSSSGYPSQGMSGELPEWEGQTEEEKEILFRTLSIDKKYLDFYGIPIIKGEDFANVSSSSEKKSYLINETAVKVIGWDDPLGKSFQDGVIIGVVKDFHSSSMKSLIKPLGIDLNENEYGNYLSLRINSNNSDSALEHIKAIWEKFSLFYPFEYSFLEERLENLYVTEGKLGISLTICSILSMIIASLGLFGLASFMVEQKIKEIGIRKVLGAPVSKIVYMLSFEFIKWVALASIIAFIVSEYAMNIWLNNYAYKVAIGFETYFASLLIALLLALGTVTSQTLRAAHANPVDSLRSE